MRAGVMVRRTLTPGLHDVAAEGANVSAATSMSDPTAPEWSPMQPTCESAYCGCGWPVGGAVDSTQREG